MAAQTLEELYLERLEELEPIGNHEYLKKMNRL
jgi:hypothetical protein